MSCAALLELRQNKQAERLAQENEKNVATENNAFMQPVSMSDEEPCDVSSKQNACSDGEIVEIQSETGEVSSNDGMMEITASADVSVSKKNVANTDMPIRLDQLEQTDRLNSSANEVEQREPHTTTAGQSVCIKPPPDAGRDVLQPTDEKFNGVEDNDIDVIDLSNITVQCSSISSSQNATTVCFEVCLLQLAVLPVLKVEELYDNHHHQISVSDINSHGALYCRLLRLLIYLLTC